LAAIEASGDGATSNRVRDLSLGGLERLEKAGEVEIGDKSY